MFFDKTRDMGARFTQISAAFPADCPRVASHIHSKLCIPAKSPTAMSGDRRLDFTVIGPAVNLALRIEGLTKWLLRPLLTSRAFAEICPGQLVFIGFHPVRGLRQPEEVFGLPK
jgi:hypothetical protein